jgi:hypothetical protein
MRHGEGVGRADRPPPIAVGTRQVEVLKIEEEVIIKAADLKKLAAADDKRGAGDPLRPRSNGSLRAPNSDLARKQEALAKCPIQLGPPSPGDEFEMRRILASNSAPDNSGNRGLTQELQLRTVDADERRIGV